MVDTLIGAIHATKAAHQAAQEAWRKYTLAYASNNVEQMHETYREYLHLSSIDLAAAHWHRGISRLMDLKWK